MQRKVLTACRKLTSLSVEVSAKQDEFCHSAPLNQRQTTEVNRNVDVVEIQELGMVSSVSGHRTYGFPETAQRK